MSRSQANTSRLLLLLILLIICHEARGAEPMKKGMAKVNGTSLYYEVMGKGFPVVLISGGGTLDSRAWDEQFVVFAKNYQVIRYDIRGLGKSARPLKTFSHSQDLYALLQFLKIKKAHVIGLSFGGAIAIDFAIEHPEIVDNLIVAASGLSSDAKSEANVQAVLGLTSLAKKEGIQRAIQFILDITCFISRENSSAREKIRQNYLDNRDVFESGFPLITLWQPANPPAIERLSEIRAPVLIMVAENDCSPYKAITDKLSGIGGARIVVIPGATHVINLDKPKEFNRAVLDFLGRRATT